MRYGRLAGRAAARAGAHRQAASCFALVLARGALLTPAQRGRIGEAYAWALSNSNQLQAAADEAATAVEQWRQADDGSKLVRALVTLSRQQWLTEETAQARSSAELALQLAEDRGDTLDQALARLNLGGVLVLVDQEQAGMQSLRAGIDLAERLGADDIVTLATNYLGSARLQLGDLGGRDDLLRSRDQAQQMANHEFVMRAYYNLAEGLWRLGRYDEALGFIAEGEAYGADRDFQVHAYMFRRPPLPPARDAGSVGRGCQRAARDARREGRPGHDRLGTDADGIIPGSRQVRPPEARQVIATALALLTLAVPAPARLQVGADEFSYSPLPAVDQGRAGDRATRQLRRGRTRPAPTTRRRDTGLSHRERAPGPPRGDSRRRFLPGRFTLWCSLADHRKRGMSATLVVRPAPDYFGRTKPLPTSKNRMRRSPKREPLCR